MDRRIDFIGPDAGNTFSSIDCTAPAAKRAPRAPGRMVADRLRRFHREEDGVYMIFTLMIFTLMLLATGMSLDIERFETARTKMQATADGAALAAASLTQKVDGETLVRDYFTKAGLGSFVDEVKVDKALNYKRVTVDAEINIPTHFMNHAGVTNLGTTVSAIAEESIGDVEISMVLDVSGSMGSNSKMRNLIDASEDFLDAIYENSDPGSVSTSIVPYSTQVNVGPDILKYFNRSPISHENSHCLNFNSDDFNYPYISTTAAMEQALHFDPWTNERDNWYPTQGLWETVCPTDEWKRILPFGHDKTVMKSYVNKFKATNWTSIELGVKWGAAMLDPAFRPVVTGLIGDGIVSGDFAGRPLSYEEADGLKVLVVMTDGENTEHYEMKHPYREEDSLVYVFYDNYDRPYYSIWGGTGEPNPNLQTTTVTKTDRVCVAWYYYWCVDYDNVTTTYEEPVNNWYLANDYSNDGVSDGWRSTPYGADSSTRMTWAELWAEVPVEYFADEWLADMGPHFSDDRNNVKHAREYVNYGEKDSRTTRICNEAKRHGVLVYTIGFEVKYTGSNSKALLKNCATTHSHYFDVEGTEISEAFSAIAADINRLRLIR